MAVPGCISVHEREWPPSVSKLKKERPYQAQGKSCITPTMRMLPLDANRRTSVMHVC